MYAARRDIKDIARLNLVASKHIANGAVFYTAPIFVRRYLLLEASQQRGTRLGVDDIPHLGLALLVVVFESHLIIGMHLYTKILLRINKLDKQWQTIAILLHHCLAQDIIAQLICQAVEVAPRIRTVTYHALAAGDGTDLPTLPYGSVV